MNDDDTARPIYLCQDCGAHYLPPTSMQYPTGPASQVFCSTCQPEHCADSAARRGINLAESAAQLRARRPRRAGKAPAKGGSTQRSKLL
jgi:hypothetical protein